MNPNEGRLQTGEHILAKILQGKIADIKISVAKFEKINEGSLDVLTTSDLRLFDLAVLEKEVNSVISRNLAVVKNIYPVSSVSNEFDLSRLPPDVTSVRIVEIVGFDKRPCKDPHVSNTSEIGNFHIKSVERAGKDRYRFKLEIDE